MTQENKELLLKDLCARLPYGLWIDDGYALAIHIDYSDVHFENYFNGILNGDVKPYLRPMSSMTDEEAKEIAILHDIKDILSVKVTSDYIDVIVDDGVCSTETRTIWYDEIVSSIKCFDWLNEHHFDYRGLIEKGLALEVPEGRYEI